MGVHLAFVITALVAFAAAVAFLVLAARLYRAEDIPAVRADLKGESINNTHGGVFKRKQSVANSRPIAMEASSTEETGAPEHLSMPAKPASSLTETGADDSKTAARAGQGVDTDAGQNGITEVLPQKRHEPEANSSGFKIVRKEVAVHSKAEIEG